MPAAALKRDVEPVAVAPDGQPWTLSSADRAFIRAKAPDARLTIATLLLFFRAHGRFPRDPSEIDAANIAAVARQLRVPVTPVDVMDLDDRTMKRHRAEIRALLGFREATLMARH